MYSWDPADVRLSRLAAPPTTGRRGRDPRLTPSPLYACPGVQPRRTGGAPTWPRRDSDYLPVTPPHKCESSLQPLLDAGPTSATLARHRAEVGHNKICCYHPSSGTPGLLASGIMLDAPPAVSHCPACTQALNKCHWRLNHIVEQQIKPSLSPWRTASRLSHHCHPGEQRAICPPKPFYDHSFPCKLLSIKLIESVFHIGVIITLFMDIIERHI